MVGKENEVGVTSFNRMVQADFVEKVKSEQTLERGKGIYYPKHLGEECFRRGNVCKCWSEHLNLIICFLYVGI